MKLVSDLHELDLCGLVEIQRNFHMKSVDLRSIEDHQMKMIEHHERKQSKVEF
jgi:hypothetical protein